LSAAETIASFSKESTGADTLQFYGDLSRTAAASEEAPRNIYKQIIRARSARANSNRTHHLALLPAAGLLPC
jgi:hypothetical protein